MDTALSWAALAVKSSVTASCPNCRETKNFLYAFFCFNSDILYKTRSYPAKAKEKANIIFDVCHFFFNFFESIVFWTFFAFAPAIAVNNWGLFPSSESPPPQKKKKEKKRHWCQFFFFYTFAFALGHGEWALKFHLICKSKCHYIQANVQPTSLM